MNRLSARCITVLLLAISSASAANIQQLIQQKYSPKTSFSIDFDQTIYWSVREKTSKKSGTIAIAPVDKFRIELAQETYISNGVVCWQYSKKNSQVVIRSINDIDLSFHPSNLLAAFLAKYTFTEKQEGDIITLSAVDTATDADYKSVTITASGASGLVKRLIFTDKNDNVHTYIFRKTVFNTEPDPTLFEFEVPSDAAVIDHRS